MNWDVYTTFSLISGLLTMAAAALPNLKASERAGLVLSGLVFGGYGVFVATRSSGTYLFPVWIFLAPFPVSYTHLDVYKRQGSPGPARRHDHTGTHRHRLEHLHGVRHRDPHGHAHQRERPRLGDPGAPGRVHRCGLHEVPDLSLIHI